MAGKNIETGRDSKPQLYDLDRDIGETRNLFETHLDVVEKMEDLMQTIQQSGHRFVI